MTTASKALLGLIVSVTLSSTSGAWAKGHDDHGKDHGKKEKHEGHGGDHHDRDERTERVVLIQPNDRSRIHQYIKQRHATHCPPGHARKGWCGPHDRRYRVGYALPSYVRYQPVPRDLVVELQPVPVGYQYVMVDQDVLLISQASHQIIDAITLLSAVR